MLVYLYTKPKNVHNKLRNQGVCVSNGTTNLVVVYILYHIKRNVNINFIILLKVIHNQLKYHIFAVTNNNDRYPCICFTKSALTNRHC